MPYSTTFFRRLLALRSSFVSGVWIPIMVALSGENFSYQRW